MADLHWPSVVVAFLITAVMQGFVYMRLRKDERFLALGHEDRRKALILFGWASAALVALMTAFGAWSAFLR